MNDSVRAGHLILRPPHRRVSFRTVSFETVLPKQGTNKLKITFYFSVKLSVIRFILVDSSLMFDTIFKKKQPTDSYFVQKICNKS